MVDVTYKFLPPPLDKSKDFGWNWATGILLDYESEIYDNQYDSDELEKELWDGFYGYVKAGLSLRYMAYFHKYKDRGYRTFKQYCQKYVKISEGYAKKLMEAADVALSLIKAGYKQIPTCISQAAPLIKYNVVDSGGNSPLAEQWDKVLDYVGNVNNGRVTATAVKDVLECNTGKKRLSLGLDSDEWQLLESQAAKAGLSKQEFLRRLLKGDRSDSDDLEGEGDEFEPPEDYEYDRYTETDYYEDVAQEIIETPEAPKKHRKLASEFIRLLLQLEVRFEGLEDAQKVLASAEASKRQKIEARNFINILERFSKAIDEPIKLTDNFDEMPENRGIP